MNEITKKPRQTKAVVKTKDPAAREIAELHEFRMGLAKKDAAMAWEIGRRLADVRKCLPHGEFRTWIEMNLPFGKSSAAKYMSVYARYRDVSEIEGRAVTEVYVEAGITKLLVNPETTAEARGPIRVAGDSKARFDEALLRTPVRSSAVLEAYRVHVDGAYVVIGRLGMPPMTFGTVDFPFPPEAQEVESFIKDGIQQVIELGLEKLEAMEKAGTVKPPVDESISGQSRRGERLTNKRRIA